MNRSTAYADSQWGLRAACILLVGAAMLWAPIGDVAALEDRAAIARHADPSRIQDPGLPRVECAVPADAIPLSEAQAIASRECELLYGKGFELASALPICDPSGALFAYDFTFVRSGLSHSYEAIATEALEAQHIPLHEKIPLDAVGPGPTPATIVLDPSEFRTGHRYVVVSARPFYPAVRATGPVPSCYHAAGWIAANLARTMINDPLLEKLIFSDLYGRWFVFSDAGQTVVCSGSPPFRALSGEEFDSLVSKRPPGAHLQGGLKRTGDTTRSGEDYAGTQETLRTHSREWTMIAGYDEVRPRDWHYGCSPTAGSMVLDFWDVHGGWGLLNGWNFEAWDPLENETDFQVAELQERLADAMGTDPGGWTLSTDICPGLRACAPSQWEEVCWVCATSGPYPWCTLQMRGQVNQGHPFIWSSDFGWGGGAHSTAAFGFDFGANQVIAYNTWDGSLHAYSIAGGSDDFSQIDGGEAQGSWERNVHLLSPIGDTSYNGDGNGEAWEVNSSHTIVWDNWGDPGTEVRLYYSTTGGEAWEDYELIAATDDDGSYHWIPPCDAVSDRCRVMIRQYAGPYLRSSDGSFGNFRLTAVPLVDPPLLVSPSDQSLCQGTSGVVVWQAEPGAVEYRVQIGETCGSGTTHIVQGTSYAYSGLEPGTTYFWRVRSRNSCDQFGPYSSCFSFTTDPGVLEPPELQSPPNGAEGQPLAGTLNWEDVPGATEYTIQLGLDCGQGEELQVADSQFAYSNLLPMTTYYWRVKTRNECNDYGPFSDCFAFTTRAPSHVDENDAEAIASLPVGVYFSSPYRKGDRLLLVGHEGAHGWLGLFGVDGRLICTIWTGVMGGTAERLSWNGTKSVSGKPLSGVYYLRGHIGTSEVAEKVLIVQ